MTQVSRFRDFVSERTAQRCWFKALLPPVCVVASPIQPKISGITANHYRGFHQHSATRIRSLNPAIAGYQAIQQTWYCNDTILGNYGHLWTSKRIKPRTMASTPYPLKLPITDPEDLSVQRSRGLRQVSMSSLGSPPEVGWPNRCIKKRLRFCVNQQCQPTDVFLHKRDVVPGVSPGFRGCSTSIPEISDFDLRLGMV